MLDLASECGSHISMDVDQVIARAGGVVALSRATGIKPSTISKWRVSKKGIPADRVPLVSDVTGIPRHEIRDDLWEAPQPERAA